MDNRYEEALERARKYYNELRACRAKEKLEEIFPELRESEDERIRKFLVTIVNNLSAPNFKEVDRKNVLAWLEKQKEASKAIEAVDRIDKYIDEHLANAHDMKDSNPDKKYYRGWDDALGKMAGILQDVYSEEKQEERKPEGVYVDCTEHPEWYGIPPKEQKPAEWSEEDENNIGWLVAFLQGETGSGDVIGLMKESLISWLKSLRPQPKQEENIGKELLYVAEKQYERGKKDGYREGFDEGYKKANEAMSFHYDMSHNSTPCYAPGGVCTNPQMDCINCPKKTTGGSFTVTTKSDEK